MSLLVTDQVLRCMIASTCQRISVFSAGTHYMYCIRSTSCSVRKRTAVTLNCLESTIRDFNYKLSRDLDFLKDRPPSSFTVIFHASLQCMHPHTVDCSSLGTSNLTEKKSNLVCLGKQTTARLTV